MYQYIACNSYLIINVNLLCLSSASSTIELAAIVCLQDSWWTQYCEDAEQRPCNTLFLLRSQRLQQTELCAMASIAENESKLSIRCALHVNQVDLSSCLNPSGEKGGVTSLLLLPLVFRYTHRACCA